MKCYVFLGWWQKQGDSQLPFEHLSDTLVLTDGMAEGGMLLEEGGDSWRPLCPTFVWGVLVVPSLETFFLQASILLCLFQSLYMMGKDKNAHTTNIPHDTKMGEYFRTNDTIAVN